MMVIGMVFSYTIFSAFSWLLMKSFLVASTFTLDHGYLTDNWVGLIAMLIMYSAVEMTTATLSFRLITTLPHHMASMVGFGAASRVDAEDFEKSSTRPVEQGADTARQVGTQYLEGLKDEAKKWWRGRFWWYTAPNGYDDGCTGAAHYTDRCLRA